MAYKIIESANGVGEVLRAGEYLCKVRYRLQHRENTQTEQGEISGEISVNETERRLVKVLNGLGSGEVFTLRLADKRTLQISIPSGDALKGVWHFENSSPEGFAPAKH